VTLLQDFAADSAERAPDATALVMGSERLTYGELEANSNRLAQLLTERGLEAGDRVGLLVSKSPAAIVAMHGVLKAGGAYVPVDVASPAPRVAKIVNAAEPRLVMADHGAVGLVDELLRSGEAPALKVGSVSEPLQGEAFESAFAAGDWADLSEQPLAASVSQADMAHILFTSGSTGTPKGVVITHANVVAFIEWATRYFGTKASDRISGHPPLHFDLSTFDIYGTFSSGAELHLVPSETSVNPRGLAAMIRDAGLTQWFSVPSVLTYMAKFDAVANEDFPSLERLLWCGEVLPTPVLAHWMRRLPHVSFTNLYGPTEATIASSYYTVPECPADETQPVPIGVACEGEKLLVLGEGMSELPQGETGDLYIGGVGLSPGYWRDEEKTREAFVDDPRSPGSRLYRTGDLARLRGNGQLDFLGRADSQIKSRGYRIELGEIEAALNAFGGLKECAVVGLDTGGFEGTSICCAFAPAEGSQLEAVEVRKSLTETLPSYMLPTRWLILEALPKNVNGKIDRRALRERFAEEAQAAGAA
jgi:amino acid adenylation domain-containing protein